MSGLLVTVTGRDRPGVSAALFDVLAGHGVDVADVAQHVVHERLVLTVLVDAGPGADVDRLRAGLAGVAEATGTDVAVDEHDVHPPPARGTRHVVTVLGTRVGPVALAEVTRAVASCDATVERVEHLARYPADAYELVVSGGDADRLRAALVDRAAAGGVDVAVQRASLARRRARLVCMDVDSTLVQGEVIELLAEHAGLRDEVARVTEAAMRGELDFEESLRARVALLAGLDVGVVQHVLAHLRLTPGARTLVRTLRRLGYVVGVVSGGFTLVTDVLAERLGLDFAAANVLEVVDGRLTGGLVGEVVDRAGKERALRRFAEQAGVPLAATVAVGDGANDLDMLAAAGLGVAFNAKPVVVEATRSRGGVALSLPYLDAVLFLLGVPREEVDEADATDPLVERSLVDG